MSPRTPQEIKQIHELLQGFIGVINRTAVDRQVALDALEFALHDLLAEVCASEEQLLQYHDMMRERDVFL